MAPFVTQQPTHDTIHPASSASEGGLHVFVYLLRSKSFPEETYVGFTSDLKRRIAEHNSGKSTHTNKFKPWELVAYIGLPEPRLAEELKSYLKSG